MPNRCSQGISATPRPGRWRRLWIGAPAALAVALMAGADLAYSAGGRAGALLSSAPTPMGPGWTDSGCGSCHKIDAIFSHPVGVAPSMSVPGQLPLTDGRLTCTTCHDDSTSSAHVAARQDHTPMLRPIAEGAATFCTQCHNPTDVRSRKAMHGAYLGKAHLVGFATTGATGGAGKGGRTAAPRVLLTRSVEMDQDSRNCLSCHDGSMATDVGGNPEGGMAGDYGRSHPVAVAYPVGGGGVSMGGIAAEFKAPAQLDRRLRLFDGQVGCGTCHSPFATQAKLLVMNNLRSRLCLSCHVQ